MVSPLAIGNIFARQQSIVGPSISNGKEACVVVFPTVLLILVHGPLHVLVGHVCVVLHVPCASQSYREFILSEPECEL